MSFSSKIRSLSRANNCLKKMLPEVRTWGLLLALNRIGQVHWRTLGVFLHNTQPIRSWLMLSVLLLSFARKLHGHMSGWKARFLKSQRLIRWLWNPKFWSFQADMQAKFDLIQSSLDGEAASGNFFESARVRIFVSERTLKSQPLLRPENSEEVEDVK